MTSPIAKTILVAMLILANAGCSRVPVVGKLFGGLKKDGVLQAVEFRVAFPKATADGTTLVDQMTARPGDPVYLDVIIRNGTNKPLTVQPADVSTIEFYLKGPAGTDPVQVRPVFSQKDPGKAPPILDPGRMEYRRFVFTTLTRDPGQYLLLAWYHVTPRGIPSGLPPAISKAITLEVAGERFCRRDRDGILVKDHAVALAKRQHGRPVADTKALLLEDEYGFLVWWVTLTIDEKEIKPGEEAHKAYFVCPYKAMVINRPARPYIPDKQEKPPALPRFQITPPAGQ